jgi:hypothetical protein
MERHGYAVHGKRLLEYSIWLAMKDRCHNPRCRMYLYYGGRGIVVCDRWRKSFVSFLSDVGMRPDPTLTLDRIDNNSGYFPGNVQWATRAHQVRNRRNNVVLQHDGRNVILTDLAREHGMLPQVLKRRLDQGTPLAKALVRGYPGSGESNSQAKLKTELIGEVRRMLDAGVSQRVIAAKFGVCQQAVSRIKIGKTWSHV